MTYLQFIHRITGPIGVAIFPSSGNLYYNHVRVGYLDFNRHSEEQEVNFFRPASIPRTIGPDRSEEEKLRDIVKQLTALSVIHSVEVRNIAC
ncbi:hypothetical protein SBP1_gp091 [Vibrio virus vB_VspP_SBP1]|uniref:Uncharacterized protein n=1 Tax=Vibrio virus vB_VspP_SBP1 TaxID=2500581 RepID=A0A3T0IIR8_9CAUD|nr:hypothetical protein KNU36_gp038 [Vibrio virus vB_VspP_SBP1]AZU99683.1 hypothetical protein SBP1_gp091 [Vibrio virus vB_VspP_SBP1]